MHNHTLIDAAGSHGSLAAALGSVEQSRDRTDPHDSDSDRFTAGAAGIELFETARR